MTNKKPEKPLSERFEEEIRQELASGQTSKPSLDEFKVLVYKDRAKRRRKRTTIAAGIILALLAGFFALEMCVDDVGADKSPKEEIITEDGVIIEDGGWGSSVGEENVWVTEDWEQVEDAKAIAPEILIPSYVPEGYSFSNGSIEFFESGALQCTYFFHEENGKNIEMEVFVDKGGESSLEIVGYEEIINASDYNIYVRENKKRIATTKLNDGTIITVWCNVSNEEIAKIINGVKR